jgi:hypothetical protein
MVDHCELDPDLLTYFHVFEARGMKFGPSIPFWMPMSVVDHDGIHHDLLTYFPIFKTRVMKFLFQITHAEAIHSSQYLLTQVSDSGPCPLVYYLLVYFFVSCVILSLNTKIA